MIAPDTTLELRAERRFDLVASLLIGLIAVMAALLAVVQMSTSQAATRADLQAARLAADLSARISISGQASGAVLLAQQTGLMVGLEATGREITGLDDNDPAALSVGQAAEKAYEELRTWLTATTATSGGAPLESYTASMVNATTPDLEKEVLEQNRQVDLANDESTRSQWATLGLSFLALSGVLTGLAAVLHEGRAGWLSIGVAGLMLGGAVLMAGLAVI